jgi:hypothetical protein
MPGVCVNHKGMKSLVACRRLVALVALLGNRCSGVAWLIWFSQTAVVFLLQQFSPGLFTMATRLQEGTYLNIFLCRGAGEGSEI